MPIGTGNDLSRSINFGEKIGINYLHKFFHKLDSQNSEVIKIDLWKVKITDIETNKVIKDRKFLLYIGIGYDASVVYYFEKLRKKLPFLF